MKTVVDGAPPDAHPPDFALELLHAGEGDAAGREAGPWRTHTKDCPHCTAKLAELARHGAAYRTSPEAHRLRALLGRADDARTPGRRPARPGSSRPRSWLVLFLPVAAAAAVWVAVGWRRARDPGGDLGDLRIKGHARLGAVLRRAGQSTKWEGARLHPADELQMAWAGPTAGFLVVVAREAAGETLQLFPEHGARAGAVGAGREQAIGASLTISPRSRPFAVAACFTPAPVPVATFVEAVRRAAGAAAAACAGETQVLEFAVEAR